MTPKRSRGLDPAEILPFPTMDTLSDDERAVVLLMREIGLDRETIMRRIFRPDVSLSTPSA